MCTDKNLIVQRTGRQSRTVAGASIEGRDPAGIERAVTKPASSRQPRQQNLASI
jgi:hypothetical protein